MNKWQNLPRDLWFLKWKALGASSPSADFGRLRTSSEDFELLWKTSDFFGNLRKWSCRVQKSQHSQDKNLTLISQKSWQVYKHFLFLKHLYIKGIYFLSLNRNYLSFTNIFLCFFNELDHLHLKKITTNIKIITLQELEDGHIWQPWPANTCSFRLLSHTNKSLHV